MKTCLLLLLLAPALIWGKVGPDLDTQAHVDHFTKLRMDYVENPGTEYFPLWRLDPEHKKLLALYNSRESEAFLEAADAWLKKCPIDADTHLRAAMVCKATGDFRGYNHHLGIFYGLLQSITSTGDGKSPETAFKVISVQEEYSLIQEIGGTVLKQELVSGPSDKMTVSRQNGTIEFDLYFNVFIPMDFMNKQVEAAKPK